MFGINRYTLLCMKQVSHEDLLYSTGNYIQYHVIIYIGKESEKVCMCVYLDIYNYIHIYSYIESDLYACVCVHPYKTKSLCCTPENDTVLQVNYRLTKKKKIWYILKTALRKKNTAGGILLFGFRLQLQRYSKRNSTVRAQN